MLYQAGAMQLKSVRQVFCGEANDIEICYDIHAPSRVYYTLLVIKEHHCAKKVLQLLYKKKNLIKNQKKGYLACFPFQNQLCFLFDYFEERPIQTFFFGSTRSLYECEQIGINLILECISNELPYPLLYLILTQKNVHINQDSTIYFTYLFDLAQLDESIQERQCASACAMLVLELLQQNGKKHIKSLELLQKKVDRNAYRSFSELYRDIKLTEVPEKNIGILKQITYFIKMHQDQLFRYLLYICLCLFLFAVLVLVSQIFFKDVPFFRLFQPSFEKIGTEVLK